MEFVDDFMRKVGGDFCELVNASFDKDTTKISDAREVALQYLSRRYAKKHALALLDQIGAPAVKQWAVDLGYPRPSTRGEADDCIIRHYFTERTPVQTEFPTPPQPKAPKAPNAAPMPATQPDFSTEFVVVPDWLQAVASLIVAEDKGDLQKDANELVNGKVISAKALPGIFCYVPAEFYDYLDHVAPKSLVNLVTQSFRPVKSIGEAKDLLKSEHLKWAQQYSPRVFVTCAFDLPKDQLDECLLAPPCSNDVITKVYDGEIGVGEALNDLPLRILRERVGLMTSKVPKDKAEALRLVAGLVDSHKVPVSFEPDLQKRKSQGIPAHPSAPAVTASGTEKQGTRPNHTQSDGPLRATWPDSVPVATGAHFVHDESNHVRYQMVRRAKKSVYLSTLQFDNMELENLLIEVRKSGIEVTVLLGSSKWALRINRAVATRLRSMDIRVLVGANHSKCVVVDETHVFIGSANVANSQSFEASVVLESKELARQVLAYLTSKSQACLTEDES